jgi:hypothetical protein
MPRLISFGCSYAYGHGLPDCIGKHHLLPGNFPSKLTFAATIAKEISYDFLNLGECGSSNKKILHKILNTEYKSTDILIVHWSHYERNCIIKNNEKIIDINSWTNTKQNKIYYKFLYDDYDSAFSTITLIDYINLKLKKNKIKILNIPPIMPTNNQTQKLFNQLLDKDVLITNYNIHDCKIDYAADNSHPGINSHTLLAKKILENYNLVLQN